MRKSAFSSPHSASFAQPTNMRPLHLNTSCSTESLDLHCSNPRRRRRLLLY
jgi:hypothetical protein